MLKDYRCTKYSKDPFVNLKKRKELLMKSIREIHPHSNNIYEIVSREFNFKKLFAECYGNRCAYCGLLVDITSLDSFEIDHIIARATLKGDKNKKVNSNNSLENLALSCRHCNNRKNKLDFTDPERKGLHPYKRKIKKIFYRDEEFYIKITPSEHNKKIQEFYDKLFLGAQLKRVDYLLMCLNDLANIYPNILEFDRAFRLLLKRRSALSPKQM